MIDSDLAALYQVRTKALNQAAQRNPELFPGDFMFQLTNAEFDNLICQIGISSSGKHGGRRKLPYVFTEPGAASLTGVLKSRRAAKTYVAIMRAFVRARHFFAANKDLERRMARLEGKTEKLDEDVKAVLKALKRFIGGPEPPRRRIGFGT